ncbi:hypothetical protein DBR40_22575 [Pedobacter sp. KBW01]|nr:hypothetical protein DBR40_22575 [Pedobacter sp. KBW01]
MVWFKYFKKIGQKNFHNACTGIFHLLQIILKFSSETKGFHDFVIDKTTVFLKGYRKFEKVFSPKSGVGTSMTKILVHRKISILQLTD